MKLVAHITSGLLGLLFVVFGLNFFLGFIPMPPPPAADTPAGMFMGALFPTGYLAMVKVLEILGGVLVAVPQSRNLGLLILGPIIVNIAAFHGFIAKQGLFGGMMIAIYAMALIALWSERKAWLGLIKR
jgi:putative oxidoreductase